MLNNSADSVVVWFARTEDIPALEDIAQAVSSSKEAGYFERCLAEQDQGRRAVLMACVDEVPAGFGMLNWNPGYAPFRRLGIPEIQDLNTHPAFRRRGVASAVIERCEELAGKKGATHMGIGVGLYAGYGAAQRLYVRLGYVPDGAGVVYDRAPVAPGEIRPVDDDLNLMMLKVLSAVP